MMRSFEELRLALRRNSNTSIKQKSLVGNEPLIQVHAEVKEYSLPKLFDKLHINHEEFVDLCILLGCDYCEKIPGLGPKRALTLIQKHHTIENVLLHINRKTYPVPHFWKYNEARKIFLDQPHTCTPGLTWREPDEEALVGFLCHTKHNREERVRHRLQRFREKRGNKREEREREKAAGSSGQTRTEEFLRVTRRRGHPVEVASSLRGNKKKLKSK